MKIKMTCIVLIACCFSHLLTAQSSDQSLVGIGGGMTQVGSLYLSYSFGEPFNSYTQINETWLTEGFQQPEPIDVMTALEETFLKYSITLYPNPAQSNLQVEWKEIPSCYQLMVINLQGQIMMRTTLTQAQASLSISSLQPGLYWVRVECENELTILKPFIKQ